MDAKGLDKTHRNAVREIGWAKRGKITRIGKRVGVSWAMPEASWRLSEMHKQIQCAK